MVKTLRDAPRAVQLRKMKDIQLWRKLAKQHKEEPLTIAQLRDCYPNASQRTLYRRKEELDQWTDSDSEESPQPQYYTAAAEVRAPAFIHRNRNRQAMPAQLELKFARHIQNNIDAKWRPVTTKFMQQEAYLFWQKHMYKPTTRLNEPPKFSKGWCQRVKWRHRLFSGKTHMVKKVKESEVQDIENGKITLALQIEEAVDKYGADCVLNMDETPVDLAECPGKAMGDKNVRERSVQIYTW